jgi:flagellar motor switch protein FliN/FliY
VLNAMTGFDYGLHNVECAPASPGELPALLASDLIFGFPVTIGESVTHYLVLDARFAKLVAASLMGAEASDDTALTEMELSAISEVASQANGSYLTNISSALRTTAIGQSVSVADPASAAAELGEDAVVASIYLQNGAGESVLVRHLLPGALVRRVLNKLQEQAAQPPPPAPRVAAPAAPAPQPVTAYAAPPAAPAGRAAEPAHPPVRSSGSVAGPATHFGPASFSQLAPAAADAEIRNLDILLDVPLQVTVELGKTQIPIKQILEYGQGSLITLDKLAGEPIDLLVNGKYFAKGEVVVIDENFGVRITSILSPAERLAQLG